MAYKKYIQKNGKLYGPYIYHSKRVDGKVISEYYGNKVSKYNYKNILFISIGIFLLIALVYFLAFANNKISGEAVLQADTSYEEGKPLEGVLELSIKEGELLPESSKIIFENAGKTQEFLLSDILEKASSEGEYYVYGEEIEGTGLGYGIEGEKEIYPEIEFTLQVYTKLINNETEQSEEEENLNETSNENSEIPLEEVLPEEVVTEEVPAEEEIAIEETTLSIEEEEDNSSTITGNSVSGIGGIFNSFFGLTGMVSMELQDEIKGVTSKNNPFVYELKEGETIELKPNSVKSGEEELEDNFISLNIENNQVIITTDYSKKEKGYGKDYIGDKEELISLNLADLNLFLEEGDLTIKLVYEEKELIQLSTTLKEGEQTSNETIVEIEEKEEVQENETINEINQTIIEISNFSFQDVGNFLTSEERDILIKNFGNISLENTKSELFNNRILINYNLGEYSIEYSYDSSLSKENLEIQMEKDRIKFLKDIANSMLKKETISEEIEEFNQTYNYT
jgi:hypothetical protein